MNALLAFIGAIVIAVIHKGVYESDALYIIAAILMSAMFVRYVSVMYEYGSIKKAPISEIVFGIVLFAICTPMLFIPPLTGFEGNMTGGAFINIFIFWLYMLRCELRKIGVWR